MYKILVIEDEKLIRSIISEYFTPRGFDVTEAIDGYDGISKINHEYDLILLDIMMPGIDGYTVCKEIRSQYDIPIIFISALSEIENQLNAYELGADDYITKPFKPSLLLAKSLAIIKRNTKKENPLITIGAISLDSLAHVIQIDGVPLTLTKKEYELLKYFITHPNRLLSRQQLLDIIWGYDYYGDGRTIDTYIKKIRKKLGIYAPYIQTVVKSGYIFKCEDHV